jgi:hypothetical protein
MDGAQEYAFNAMSHVPDDAALKTWMTQLHGIVKGALMDCLAEEKPGKAITIDTTFECARLPFCALSLLLALFQALQPFRHMHHGLHCTAIGRFAKKMGPTGQQATADGQRLSVQYDGLCTVRGEHGNALNFVFLKGACLRSALLAFCPFGVLPF